MANTTTFPPRGTGHHDVDFHGYQLRVYEGQPPTDTQRAIQWIVERPGEPFTRDDLAPALGMEGKAVGSVLSRLAAHQWLHRVNRGVYLYDPDRPVQNQVGTRVSVQARQTSDLKPITEHLDDTAFKAVGLVPVATASDGDRICVDDSGTAWRVRVTVEAKLI